MSLAVPLYILHSLAPVFFQRFVPVCHPTLKAWETEMSSYFDRPIRAIKHIHTLDHDIARHSRLEMEIITQSKQRRLEDSGAPIPPPAAPRGEWEKSALIQKIEKGAYYCYDSIRIYSHFPTAILAYHWVDGADVKYQDEYRAFLLARENLRSNFYVKETRITSTLASILVFYITVLW